MFTLCFKEKIEPTPDDHCFVFKDKSEILISETGQLQSMLWGELAIIFAYDPSNKGGQTFVFLGTETSDSDFGKMVNIWLIRFTDKLSDPILKKHGIKWAPIRSILREISQDKLVSVFRAYHIENWLDRYQYCPTCGNKLSLSTIEVALECTICVISFYPTISPAIIVAITRNGGTELLLAHAKNRTSNWLSLIAGFCEAGESIEQTVYREVHEETGLEIDSLKYVSSQGWPFSQSLMLGFTAQYKSGTLNPDPAELDGADWYGLDELPAIPPPPSIANHLITLVRAHYLDGKKPLD